MPVLATAAVQELLTNSGNLAAMMVAIAVATLASEDLTCIATGLLVHRQEIGLVPGTLACFLGIFIGDLGLWLMGRILGEAVLKRPRIRRVLPAGRIDTLGEWFDRHGFAAVIASRFTPGTRLPFYVGAGVVGRRAGRFVVYALIAAAIWTPLIVGIVAAFGDAIVGPLEAWFGSLWMALPVAAVLIFAVMRIGMLSRTETGRARLVAAVSKLWRWEFWPRWCFYPPVISWIGWLAIRYRGLTVPTAANPGMPHGGVVGESKFEILSQLPQDAIVPSALIQPGPIDHRVAQIETAVEDGGWSYPIVLKPDTGERGAGVRLAEDGQAVQSYLEANPDPILVQARHPGLFEAGVFYYRMPDADVGQILSITDKHFPIVQGDGESTVERLIWRHARLRMQAGTFLARLDGQAESVLPQGERLPLVFAGNHCQGTMFRDGAHLVTTQLTNRIDEIARAFDGFFFGRFDVRYEDVEAFKQGREFQIVELNGVLSESTNVYDPDWTLWRAYRQLFRQWSLLYQIGDANRRRGHRVSTLRELVQTARTHYQGRTVSTLSD